MNNVDAFAAFLAQNPPGIRLAVVDNTRHAYTPAMLAAAHYLGIAVPALCGVVGVPAKMPLTLRSVGVCPDCS